MGEMVCEHCPILNFAADVFDPERSDLGVFFFLCSVDDR